MKKRQIKWLARLLGYLHYRHHLPRLGRLPREQRKAYVFNKVKRTLERAFEGTRFYRDRFREIGFIPMRHFNGLADLQRLPLLTKDDVRNHYEQMVDRRFLFGSALAHSSGTTGQPTAFRLSLGQMALDHACRFRNIARADDSFRAPHAALRTWVPTSPGEPLWKLDWWENALYMSAYHLTPSNADEYVSAILKFRPTYLKGYPSSLNFLAECAYSQRKKLSFIRGTFTASEILLPSERANIEKTFGSSLYDWYGMSEPSVIVTERTDHGGMEMNWESGYPEFVC